MKREQTLAVCGFALLVILECPVMPAQTGDANPVLKTSELFIQTCDSLKNPTLGETLTDAANRHQAWWHCLEKGEGAGAGLSEGKSPPENLDNGRFASRAVPGFVGSPSPAITRTDVDVHTSSPAREPFVFTLGSGPWRKVISVNLVLRDGHRFLSTLRLTHKAPRPSIQ
jgi:hypothetical protein